MTYIQRDVHSMLRTFNVTYIHCDGHGHATRQIKLNQVALLPVVIARPAFNVPSLGLEHQQWISGTGKASARREAFLHLYLPTILRRADQC